jgi:DNA-binding beta-propeller fold protein YncE
MPLFKSSTRSVNPVVAAIAILFVLAAVQYFWWQGLVAKELVPAGGGSPTGGPGPDAVQYIRGLPGAQVETLAGAPDPGDNDGLGRDARFDGPSGLGLDASGNIYVADTRNNRVRIVAPDGRTRTLTGREAGFQDGPVGDALFNGPSGIAVAPDGTIYVADANNHRVRRIRDGVVATVAGAEQGMADGPAASARFNLPTAIAWMSEQGRDGALIVADSGNRRLRLVRLAEGQATVETLRIVPGVPSGIAVRDGVVAVTLPDQGALDIGATRLKRVPVTPKEEDDPVKPGVITLSRPVSVCSAPDGWYVASMESAALLQVRGHAAEVIAGVCQSRGITVGFRDGAGNKAGFGLLNGIVADGKRHIYVADATNNAIRRITLP